MDGQVLVAYATKHGATAEIAEKIGQVLREAGLQADVLSVNRISNLTPYKAIVLGSAVYIGQWRKEAVAFLKTYEKELAERPVWLFSSVPTGEVDPVELTKGWRIPEALQPIVDSIQPRDIAVFGGALDPKKLNLVERWAIKNIKAPLSDFRVMNTSASSKRSPLTFFVLVFALSIPIWLIGFPGPINVPMTFVPIIAASILVYREDKLGGVKRLLKRAFDYKRIRQKSWYVPIIFLNPLIFLLSYGVMRLIGLPLPDEPQIPLLAPLLFVLFFILAIGEEAGWTGYVTDPMQERWSALTTGIILGLVTAIWHYPALIEMGRTPTWMAWWTLGTVPLRILTVWLYNNTGKSVFAAILFHDMFNFSLSLFPNYGSYYNPAVGGAITAITAVIVAFLWGSKTLARYRYAGSN